LADDDVDLIATDHSPAPAASKQIESGDFVRAWGGIASLQLGLAVVWTGAKARGHSIDRLASWLARAPAQLAGLAQQKGSIAIGHDADLVIWDPDAITTVDAASLYHRHPITPYDGARLAGRIHTTLLRGEIIYADGETRGAAGRTVVTSRVG
jgi:allantoinase